MEFWSLQGDRMGFVREFLDDFKTDHDERILIFSLEALISYDHKYISVLVNDTSYKK